MSLTRDPALVASDLVGALGIALAADGDLYVGAFRVRPIAVGWATVDLDRAEAEAAAAGVGAAGPFVAAGPDLVLGVSARLGPDRDDRPRIVLLEPFTEGRLAATLARHGEGWAALYVAPVEVRGAEPDAGDPGPAPADADPPRGPVRTGSGPLGDGTLVVRPPTAGPATRPEAGPWLVVVAAGGTLGTSGTGDDPRGTVGDGVPSRP